MTSRSIGYSRKSTSSQTNDPDVEALKANGCHQIFQEKISSRVKAKDRPELQAALNCLIEGDCLVVTSLSRLARTQSECIEILHSLQERGIFIKSIYRLSLDKIHPKEEQLLKHHKKEME